MCLNILVKPFQHTTQYAAKDFENLPGSKNVDNLFKWQYDYWIELKTLWQRRNCSISPFATMFSTVVCCRLVKIDITGNLNAALTTFV